MTPSNTHDSKIIQTQLIELKKDYPSIFNCKNFLIGDTAYDNYKLKKLVEDLEFNKLVTPKNKRNTKNQKIINKKKLTLYEKMLLSKRYGVEHIIGNFKSFKKIQLRYERYIKTYSNFIYLACLLIINKKTAI